VSVPERAVRALTEAHRRAVAACHSVVLVQDGKLIRREGNEVIVLKPIRGRKKVLFRVKRREP
jgi:hypothetical protein